MPILLEDDLNYPLPRMYKVRQSFPRPKLDDIERRVSDEISRPEIKGRIKPGASVAVGVGSRGVKNLSVIVRAVLNQIKEAGGHPFIVSAMGSHGGGAPEGQREVLRSYGITEESMGVEIVTSVDVVRVGKTSRGIDVYFDKAAMSADLVVPINRVKLHTDFVADIQSGLCKMLVIGLGNHIGCSAIHEDGNDTFGETILEASGMILKSAAVGFGVAVVENACDETALIEAIPGESIREREMELVKIARDNMPTLMIPEIDVLIVKEIGKNISGAGFDPNILGKSYILKEFVLPVPNIKRMVLLDITRESHGNAIGVGVFDVITRNVFDKLDLEQMYANAIAVKCPEDARIPLIASSEEEATRIAVKTARGADRERLKIVRIKNTLELETIEVSDVLREYAERHDKLSLI
ncbi:MAG: nickel-dependent lactate racemase [Synergistaceae bacterium]|jgi:hypothetical protein|nr:nickel-dependent lactate racemase [Synergistaceae bacterium]